MDDDYLEELRRLCEWLNLDVSDFLSLPDGGRNLSRIAKSFVLEPRMVYDHEAARVRVSECAKSTRASLFFLSLFVPKDVARLIARRIWMTRFDAIWSKSEDMVSQISAQRDEDLSLVLQRLYKRPSSEEQQLFLSDVLSSFDGVGMECSAPEDVSARIMHDVVNQVIRLRDACIFFVSLTCDDICFTADNTVEIVVDISKFMSKEKSLLRTTVVGTPYWVPPEMIDGRIALSSSSSFLSFERNVVWNMGILLTELSCVEPPYMEHPPHKALLMLQRNGVPPLEQTCPHASKMKFSDELRDFRDQCCRMACEERPSLEDLQKHPFLAKKCESLENFLSSCRDRTKGAFFY